MENVRKISQSRSESRGSWSASRSRRPSSFGSYWLTLRLSAEWRRDRERVGLFNEQAWAVWFALRPVTLRSRCEFQRSRPRYSVATWVTWDTCTMTQPALGRVICPGRERFKGHSSRACLAPLRYRDSALSTAIEWQFPVSKHTQPLLHNVINPGRNPGASPPPPPRPTICCLLPSRVAQFERQMQYCGLAAETLETKWHTFARFAPFFPSRWFSKTFRELLDPPFARQFTCI